MARIHTSKRGSSHSTRPVLKRTPSWCDYRSEEVESMVIKLAKEGNPGDKIGGILRDQYGVPLVKVITGKKISQIVKEANLGHEIPDDLTALLRKANKMKRHIEKNKSDHRNTHNFQLLESRIHRLAVFYMDQGLLPKGWKYKPVVGSFL
ncbi:MAG: 30S ribosomal protein S15 [Candidatus Bathyarchaeota archaeon]